MKISSIECYYPSRVLALIFTPNNISVADSEITCKKCNCNNAIVRVEIDEENKKDYVITKVIGVFCKDCDSTILNNNTPDIKVETNGFWIFKESFGWDKA